MFWKKKNINEPFCIHEWQLTDYRTVDSYNGIDVDIIHKYEIGCGKCRRIRVIDKFEFSRMADIGLIINIQKVNNETNKNN